MRIVRERSGRRVDEAPSHSEVNQERPTRFEPKNQILAAPLQTLDDLARQLGGDPQWVEGTHEPAVVDIDLLKASSHNRWFEATADGLHPRQLGHPATLADHVEHDARSIGFAVAE